MKDTDFAYASAYTHTLENRMLGKADFDALLAASSLEDAMKFLSEKGYGNGNKAQSAGQKLDAQTLLRDELVHTWNEVKSACPKEAPIDILLYRNDFHNLKTILKSVFSGTAYQTLMLVPYTVAPDEIHQAIAKGKIESLPVLLKEPAAEAYHILARDNDGQLAEIVLDKALFSAMNEAAKQSKNTFLSGWVDLNIAIMNIRIALRGSYAGKDKDFLRDSMLECQGINADELADAAARDVSEVFHALERSGYAEAATAARDSTAAFEKYCDNELVGYACAARRKLFGFETVLGFFIGKQFEIQAVRIILSGLQSGVPTEFLRERLRDSYV